MFLIFFSIIDIDEEMCHVTDKCQGEKLEACLIIKVDE